jgi:hypothetical protein
MKEMVRQSDSSASRFGMPRLSARYRVNGLTVEWLAPQGGLVLPKRKKSVTAELLDLSIAGALIRAPESSAIRVGLRIDIRLSGEPGIVEVRNVRPDEDGTALYGVVFHRISPGLEAAIYDGIARLRNDERLVTEWNRRA